MFSRILINKNKPTKYTFILAFIIFFLATAAGYIKSNFFDNDIYLSADSASLDNLSGSWVEKIPGKGDEFQGFTLYKDGRAESIKIDNLLIQKWRIEDGILILTINNIKKSLTADEKYEIKRVSEKKLTLQKGNYLIEYERLK